MPDYNTFDASCRDQKKTFTASCEDLTVYASDGVETWDLNAGGEQIANTGELLGFIDELHNQGAFDAQTKDELAASVMADRVW